ncbi:protein yippee-like [Prunus yedoensis var. nudiflora]|uniref:Protein yippee-like n=1 Tax=Prunus yedoensis var. nudiflora TaxID=2094558 RepID=A0A314UJA0_PRUYE|nr:protein yippee-like [Prunus yedoensis var. nudiflora]
MTHRDLPVPVAEIRWDGRPTADLVFPYSDLFSKVDFKFGNVFQLPSWKCISVQHCGEHNAWSRGREANDFGLHTVEDIFCCCCGQILGWKYVIAHDKNQIYKEGKFVLERWRIEEDVAEEFNLEAHPGSSDAEIP